MYAYLARHNATTFETNLAQQIDFVTAEDFGSTGSAVLMSLSTAKARCGFKCSATGMPNTMSIWSWYSTSLIKRNAQLRNNHLTTHQLTTKMGISPNAQGRLLDGAQGRLSFSYKIFLLNSCL